MGLFSGDKRVYHRNFAGFPVKKGFLTSGVCVILAMN